MIPSIPHTVLMVPMVVMVLMVPMVVMVLMVPTAIMAVMALWGMGTMVMFFMQRMVLMVPMVVMVLMVPTAIIVITVIMVPTAVIPAIQPAAVQACAYVAGQRHEADKGMKQTTIAGIVLAILLLTYGISKYRPAETTSPISAIFETKALGALDDPKKKETSLALDEAFHQSCMSKEYLPCRPSIVFSYLSSKRFLNVEVTPQAGDMIDKTLVLWHNEVMATSLSYDLVREENVRPFLYGDPPANDMEKDNFMTLSFLLPSMEYRGLLNNSDREYWARIFLALAPNNLYDRAFKEYTIVEMYGATNITELEAKAPGLGVGRLCENLSFSEENVSSFSAGTCLFLKYAKYKKWCLLEFTETDYEVGRGFLSEARNYPYLGKLSKDVQDACAEDLKQILTG